MRPRAGLGFTVAAVLLSAVGALAASRNSRWSLAFWPALGWGLLYGCLASAVALALTGQSLVWPTAVSWWLRSLAYLAVAGTVVAFGGFLTLQQRLGPGKAATVGVMTPVLALAVSTALEGFRPDAYATAAGAALAILGNVLMLRRDAVRATA
jgi:drug/metabolite transporter (DMT)-like permease